MRIYPNQASCQRLAMALVMELFKDWPTGHRHLDMESLEEKPLTVDPAQIGTELVVTP